jgi:DNA-directed RNA polymerase specialized sigma54-like protein
MQLFALERFIATQNVARFTEQLAAEPDAQKRAILVKLLVEEVDKLGFGPEELRTADAHLTAAHHNISRQRTLIARLNQDGRDTATASELLATLTQVQDLFERYRGHILQGVERRESGTQAQDVGSAEPSGLARISAARA